MNHLPEFIIFVHSYVQIKKVYILLLHQVLWKKKIFFENFKRFKKLEFWMLWYLKTREIKNFGDYLFKKYHKKFLLIFIHIESKNDISCYSLELITAYFYEINGHNVIGRPKLLEQHKYFLSSDVINIVLKYCIHQ